VVIFFVKIYNDVRDFYKEMDGCEFKPLTFGIFNKIDEDDNFPLYLRNQYNEVFSIDDFEYMKFVLDDKEKKSLKKNDPLMQLNITVLKQKLSKDDKIRFYVDKERCEIYVVRVKK
jgi:predicted RNase H-like nuclease